MPSLAHNLTKSQEKKGENEKMLSEVEKERACRATLDDFIERVKQTPVYPTYVRAVKSNEEHALKMFQSLVMLLGTVDEELSLMMSSVAVDLLFAMIDQKLRNEILQEE